MIKKLLFLIVLLSFNAIYSQLSVTTITGNTSCNGGTITATVSGGTAPYTLYLTPAMQPFQVISPNVFSVSGVMPGTYTVTVIDSNNQNATAVATIMPLAPLLISADVTGSIVTISATGGMPPYQYSVNGTAYTANNVYDFSGMQGTFIALVRDAGGCIAHTPFTITHQINLNVQGQYVDYNNDGFTSVGDVIDYQISVANNANAVMTNAVVISSNATVSGGPIATINQGTTDTGTYTARKVITQNDLNNGRITANFNVVADYNNSTVGNQTSKETILNISSGIKMNAFVDTNTNGLQDSGEVNVDAGTFNFQVNGGSMTSVSSVTGRYTVYESNPTSVYNIQYGIRPELLSRYTIANGTYANVTVPANSGISTLNFALTRLPYTDASVTVSPYGIPPIPGFTYKNRIAYRNNGTTAITNGMLTFTHSPVVTITNISESGTTSITNGFSYVFANLLPNEVKYITVEMQMPTIPTVSLGQILTNTVSVNGVAGDVNAQNDNSSLSQIIVGSYDPNDKTESHGGKIVHSSFPTDEYLNYTIRFENTGTYEAVNIRVNDMLDSKLDEATIVTLDASHPYVLERKNNELNWKFNAIQLPPSVVGTAIGHGYINFKIKPKAGYAVGDIIPNTASIYFDFNPAIVTNTCNTEFVNALSNTEFEKGAFTLYPNPTNGIITIALKDSSLMIDSLSVVDATGKTVYSKAVNHTDAVIDLTSLANGMYFVKLKAGQEEKTVKVVKQ